MSYSFQFNVHHIFPRELYTTVIPLGDEDFFIGNLISNLFAGRDASFHIDSESNKIGLFVNPDLIPSSLLSSLTTNDFGLSSHGGFGILARLNENIEYVACELDRYAAVVFDR